jgi:hypothetical protein
VDGAGLTDLLVLVADKDARLTLEGILARHRHLGIRRIEATFLAGAYHDSYVFRRCHDLLRPQQKHTARAVVVFDREGCGSLSPRGTLEAEVEMRLAQNGWEGRSVAVAIDPELEAWVWSDSPHVDATLGWEQRGVQLRAWLGEQGFLEQGHSKPVRPKEALEAALRNSNKKRSSSLFRELATRVSFERCTDPAFLKLKSTLQSWFPPEVHS